MKKNTNTLTPVKWIIRSLNDILDHGSTSPENAFAMLRFAVDGSGDTEAMTAFARSLSDTDGQGYRAYLLDSGKMHIFALS